MNERFVLRLKNQTLDLLTRTHIMGILNVTPDSFSDGGKFLDHTDAFQHALTMEQDGADIIDIGGESTRPKGVYGEGALPVSVEEEMERVIPVIQEIRKRSNVPISVDTYKASVAEEALKAGADLINDISGLNFDHGMLDVAMKYQAPVVVMHIKGTPQNMQENPVYQDLFIEIGNYLKEARDKAWGRGISTVIVDPGIGFGKTLEHNFEIIKNLSYFTKLECPVLVGPSRKSFVGKLLNLPPAERIEGTAAAVAISIWNGAQMVRVHDVKEMKRVAVIVDEMKKAKEFLPPA